MTIRAGLHHVTRLQLRPAGGPRAPGGPAAPGAPLPDTRAQLFDQGHARKALRQLAAGPARQLGRALRLPRQDHRVLGHRRFPRRPRSRSIRSTSSSSPTPRRFRSATTPSCATTWHLSGAGAGGTAACRLYGVGPARTENHRQFSGRAESASAGRHPLSDPAGTGRADGGGNAHLEIRLVPRHVVAAGADSAPARIGGALRLRLPDPAQAGSHIARRPRRHHAGLHRPARLDRGLYPRRRLDRPRPDVRPAVRRGAPAGRGDAALPHGRADQRRRRSRRGDVRVRHDRGAGRREAARHAAVRRRSLDCARRARRQGRCRSHRAGRPSHHGRRADLRVDRRLPVGGMEHGRARPDQAQPRRRTDPPAAQAFRAGRAAAFRPGQVVSGRAAAALGLFADLAHGRRSGLAQREIGDRCGGWTSAGRRRCAALRQLGRGASRT